jgi:hypothetical protein
MMNIYSYFYDKIKNMSEYIKQILEHASSQGYRSNAIKPLMGGIIICFVLSMATMFMGYDIAGYIMLGFGGICVICFLIAYFLCLHKDPNLLRSEKFILEKTALEKALMSDSAKNTSIKLPESDYVTYDSDNSGKEEEV